MLFENPEDHIWLALFLPLIAAGIIALFTNRYGRISAMVSITAIVLSFLISLGIFIFLAAGPDVPWWQTLLHLGDLPVQSSELPYTWLHIGEFQIQWGFLLDPLSMLMLIIVTGIGSAIQIYSFGYMRDDPGLARYFGGLSLFTFSMLTIVIANNFLQMFIGWELVGVSSYLLIGHWYERASAGDAAKKAFITNRLGDFGFLLGIIMLWALLGTANFAELKSKLSRSPGALGEFATIIGLLIFCGAVGKSAQFPLHVWLPDAMEGPTPVSALIHAATMVAAGVYMLCRVFFIYTAVPAWPEALAFLGSISALDVIAWIGGITAVLAALMAIQQNDIKRILAYSTLSQLGYMVMAVGVSGTTAAMYHLTTHAFFKALLFLGAGSVIYALHHEQDIWNMGGLKHKMPVTFWTFLIGTLALCGLPPLSGFYSKDAILAQAYSQNWALFTLGVIVAILTTFYMFRLILVAFLGPQKGKHVAHAHESPAVMTLPLIVLAVGSALAGFFGINVMLDAHFAGGSASDHHATSLLTQVLDPFGHAPAAAFGGLLALMVGFAFAYWLYAGATTDPLPEKLGRVSRALRNRLYFDEFYDKLIARTHEAIAGVAAGFDQWIIAGLLVKGTHGTTELVGRALRLLQTGNVQTYAFLFVVGVALVLFIALK